jgi:hypothetical protein
MIADYCLRNVVPRSDAASNTDNESGVYLDAYRCLQRNLTVLTPQIDVSIRKWGVLLSRDFRNARFVAPSLAEIGCLVS